MAAENLAAGMNTGAVLKAATTTAADVDTSKAATPTLMLVHNSNSSPWCSTRSNQARATSIGVGSVLELLMAHSAVAKPACMTSIRLSQRALTGVNGRSRLMLFTASLRGHSRAQ